MSKSSDEFLLSLKHSMTHPAREETWTLVQKGLQHRDPVIVGQAARITAHFRWLEAVPLLTKTYERLLNNPVKSDPCCLGKKGIVEALKTLEVSEKDLFLHGIRYRQFEPIWGGVEDRAAGLRAECALALVEIFPNDAVLPVADLLADPEVEARRGAAVALASGFSGCALPLLRLRALSGEKHAGVLEVIFEALLDLSSVTQPDQAVAFIQQFLENEAEDVFTVAALVLGESRRSEAIDCLQEFAKQTRDNSHQKIIFDALAIARTDPAIAYLLDLIRHGPTGQAEMAKQSLEIYRSDQTFWSQVENCFGAREKTG